MIEFESYNEAGAWDGYVSGMLAQYGANNLAYIARRADDIILGRRERSKKIDEEMNKLKGFSHEREEERRRESDEKDALEQSVSN